MELCPGGAVGVRVPEGEVGALAFGALAGGEEVEGPRGHGGISGPIDAWAQDLFSIDAGSRGIILREILYIGMWHSEVPSGRRQIQSRAYRRSFDAAELSR